ncbi:hypothetical protein Ddye_013216 [Dipteronia dyeriana]|uniref:RRM domain-containing protein n=1 Tax=Dipteronia dyeriana TaxID=168575 RepID=A0AAD9X5X0_9ROSI|nr:hypothetical protein Ddye_013216 [Dipteronia dyeriana]
MEKLDRERENPRERKPDSLGHEGSQAALNGKGPIRAAREGLVSIFIDNLNQCLDSFDLWGMFKSFGKVKDVFLSSKKSSQKVCFGFIRFETIKEASKVVKIVDGMLIFGWLIHAKVASFVWKSRRSFGSSTIVLMVV